MGYKAKTAEERMAELVAWIKNSNSLYEFNGSDTRHCSVFGCIKPVTHLFNDRCPAHQTINKPDAAMIAKCP